MQHIHFDDDDLDTDYSHPQETFFLMYHEEETTQQGAKIYRCTFPTCRKFFRFKSEIIRHVAIHSSSRPFHCKHKGCNKTFKRLDALENHVRIHTMTTPFYCTVPNCERKFTTKAGLRYHILKHKDARSYKCTFPGCGKSFITVSHLRQHEKSSVFHAKSSPCIESSEEEKSIYTEISPQVKENTEENHISQDKKDIQKLLNRIIEESERLEERIEQWQENYTCSNETSPPEGTFLKHEYDTVSNQSDADSLILEFSKWHDGYSIQREY